jgi:hypothetical protein
MAYGPQANTTHRLAADRQLVRYVVARVIVIGGAHKYGQGGKGGNTQALHLKRTPMVPWYSGQGYRGMVTGALLPHPPLPSSLVEGF